MHQSYNILRAFDLPAIGRTFAGTIASAGRLQRYRLLSVFTPANLDFGQTWTPQADAIRRHWHVLLHVSTCRDRLQW